MDFVKIREEQQGHHNRSRIALALVYASHQVPELCSDDAGGHLEFYPKGVPKFEITGRRPEWLWTLDRA